LALERASARCFCVAEVGALEGTRMLGLSDAERVDVCTRLNVVDVFLENSGAALDLPILEGVGGLGGAGGDRRRG
jgi:hypothetical protein